MDLLEKEWFIEAPWGKLCIVVWGDCSDPPVLMCHGSVDSAATFRPLVKLLPRKFYYIALELPGNGKSDQYPSGMNISAYDLVYALTVVVKHFRWDQFVYMAHSVGTLIGLLYDLSYPGKMSKVINLDPLTRGLSVPAEKFAEWYHAYFTKYYERFDSFNMPKKERPKQEIKEAIATIMSNRGLSEANAIATLQRLSEPAGAGFIRYTFDQRLKLVTRPPLSPENLKRIFTGIQTPTLSIIAEKSIQNGGYDGTLFVLNESHYPCGNYRVRRVNGHHDVHFENPERIAGFVGQFLLHGLEGLDSVSKL